MRYYTSPRSVAPARVAPTPRFDGAFREAIVRFAIAVRESPACTERDRLMIRNIVSYDARYGFVTLDRLRDLAVAMADEAPAIAFCEEVRGMFAAHRHMNETRDLLADHLTETELEGRENLAVERLVTAKHRDVRMVQDALDAITQHVPAELRVMNDLFAERFALAHGGK